jgi:hypothetical protein
MKKRLQGNPAMLKIIVLFTCFMLVMLYNKSKAGDRGSSFNSPASTYKKVSVSFKQDVVKNELTVLLKADANKSMKLYFFSAEGKFVKEILISSQQETVVTDLKRGMYSYECFDNELKVKSGKLVLR